MKLTDIFLATVLAFGCSLLLGCGTETGLAPRTAKSGFDSARTVQIDLHSNAPSGMSIVITGLGAQWSEATPNQVLLLVGVFNEHTGIVGAELNIDGDKMRLERGGGVTDMTNYGGVKRSSQGFVTTVSIIERITNSKRTWLRITTPTGTMENAVIDGSKDSKAFHALKRFLVDVKSPKN